MNFDGMNIPLTDAGAVAVIVAHPDDETLWAGGTLLMQPGWHRRIVTLCRAGDMDRAPKFRRALQCYRAEGEMADLDDSPEQAPLPHALLEDTVVRLLGPGPFDILLTHGPRGEYTRHRRHEEVSRAVFALWTAGRLPGRQLWYFAYEDSNRAYYPRARADASYHLDLPEPLWQEKSRIIREVYGFAPESWEARTTPRREAFQIVTEPNVLK